MKHYNITVNGTTYEVSVEETGAAAASPAPSAPAPKAAKPASAPKKPASVGGGAVKVSAPMPGNINKINVKEGQSVKSGDILCILEAMKMENEIVAPSDGVIASVNITQGATVASGDILITMN